MLTQIGNYVLKCEACCLSRSELGFNLDNVFLWANGHGTKIRLFCHACGAVHDVTVKNGQLLIVEKHSMKCAIFETAVIDQRPNL